jgi:hypothetical protein
VRLRLPHKARVILWQGGFSHCAVPHARYILQPSRGRGETGRRKGLKIPWPQGRAGSSPAVRTKTSQHHACRPASEHATGASAIGIQTRPNSQAHNWCEGKIGMGALQFGRAQREVMDRDEERERSFGLGR